MKNSHQPDRNGNWQAAVRGNVLMIGLASLFTDLSSEMINPLLPIFVTGLVPLRLAPLFIGLSEGIAESTASLLKLVSGRISDRIGKRKSLVIFGYGLSTLARPLMSLAGLVGSAWSGWQVVCLKFADRVGKGIRTAPRDALLGDAVTPEIRGLAFSFNRALDHSGAALGSLTAILTLFALLNHDLLRSTTMKPTPDQVNALRHLFGLAFLPGLAAMIVLIWKVREIAPRKMPAAVARTEISFLRISKALPGKFLRFVAVVALFTLGNSSDMFLLLYAWEKFRMGLVSVIGLWIVLHISKIVFSLPGGLLSDRLGRRSTIIAGWTVYALVYSGLAFARSVLQFWMLFLCYGFYYGMSEGSRKGSGGRSGPVSAPGRRFWLLQCSHRDRSAARQLVVRHLLVGNRPELGVRNRRFIGRYGVSVHYVAPFEEFAIRDSRFEIGKQIRSLKKESRISNLES